MNNLIKKNYDPSIAELMAKGGILNKSENFISTPIEIEKIKEEEKKEEPKNVENTTPAVPANENSTTEMVKPDSSKPKEKEKEVEIPKIEEPKLSIPNLSWQEVLKSQQPDTILKELGFDDKMVSFLKDVKEVDPKMINFFHHWKGNGNVKEYLKELTTDYETMTSEEVMYHQLKKEYPKASEKALNALYKKEIVETYKLDSDKYSEEEVETGKLLLEAKADKFREELMNNQKNFLLPKPPEPKPSEENQEDKIRQQEFEEYRNSISNNPYTKEIFNNKYISVGEGDSKFNFPVDPNILTDILYDSNKWAESMFEIKKGQNGKDVLVPNIEHQLLVATVAKYGKQFLNKYAEHQKALGSKNAIESIENVKKSDIPSPANSDTPVKSIAEAMAKYGKVSN